MGLIVHTKKYRCSDDCLQSGCPEHEATLVYQSITDVYTFDNGNGKTHFFERGELEAFIELLKGLDRVDSIQI